MDAGKSNPAHSLARDSRLPRGNLVSALAVRAKVAGAPHKLFPNQKCSAPSARPAILAVGVERPVEVSRLAVYIDVECIKTGAALLEGVSHDVAPGVEKLYEAYVADSVRPLPWV